MNSYPEGFRHETSIALKHREPHVKFDLSHYFFVDDFFHWMFILTAPEALLLESAKKKGKQGATEQLSGTGPTH